MTTAPVDAAFFLLQAARGAELPGDGARKSEASPELAAAGRAPAPVRPPQRAELEAMLERIAVHDRRLSFHVDDDSGRTVIKVLDASTLEVIRQIPSEEMLEIARRLEAHLRESADGSGVLLADEA